MAIKVFVDTDVVISSLISPQGAAFLLLNQTSELNLYVSSVSAGEIGELTKRLNLNEDKLANLIGKRFSIVQLKKTVEEMKTTFKDYVLDKDDSHIVAGAKEADAQFLISYNTRHFKADKLKEDFNIILTTPANLLQYLRSL